MTESNEFLLASFESSNFTNIDGFPHPIQTSVMPMVAHQDGCFRSVGTCFAVTNDGVVLTARHVVDDALGDAQGNFDGNWPEGVSFGALYAAEPEPGAGVDVFGGFIPARTVDFSRSLDIAAVHLNLPRRTDTNAL